MPLLGFGHGEGFLQPGGESSMAHDAPVMAYDGSGVGREFNLLYIDEAAEFAVDADGEVVLLADGNLGRVEDALGAVVEAEKDIAVVVERAAFEQQRHERVAAVRAHQAGHRRALRCASRRGASANRSAAVMGIPALFGNLVIPETILDFSYPLLLAVSLLCFFIIQNRNINRWTGGILILFYFYLHLCFLCDIVIRMIYFVLFYN